jgi:glycogen synthase
MRVLILSWEYPPVVEGGLARHVRKLAENLVADGVEVHVLTRGSSRLPDKENRRGVIVHRVREKPYPKELPLFIAWVRRMNDDMLAAGRALAEDLDFDLVHGHDWLVAVAGKRLADEAKVPFVSTIHATE